MRIRPVVGSWSPGVRWVAVAAAGALVVGAAGMANAGSTPAATTSPPPAAAAPVGTPSGEWKLVEGRQGARLVWRSPRRLPFGDARVEIRIAGRSLPFSTVSRDGRTVSVPVPPDVDLRALQASDALRVVAGARRLDRVTPAVAPTAASVAAPVAAPPALGVDPGKAGPHRTVTGTYTLPGVRIPGLPVPVEVEGVVVSPVGTRGARPLVLFLHGRHFTCYGSGGDDITGEWPCPRGRRAVPSHRGYLQAQRLLASQGYDTVSISANGINAQDFRLPDGGAAARSTLVRHHLRLWASWATNSGRRSAPAAVRAAPVADLSKVLLVGHSRGGEGVNRAAIDTRVTPPGQRAASWRIAGLLHLAPTAFGQNPAPGVPATVVLPYCDGDVSDLQGQQYVDRMRDVAADGALRSSLLVMGANHNYFNSEWTPGVAVAPADDDWYDGRDAVCGSGRTSQRLTAAQQRAVGATYIATAVRAFVARDAKVLPLLDGTRVRAASAGKATVLSHSLGGRLARLVSPGQAGGVPTTTPNVGVAATGGPRAALCVGYGMPGRPGPVPVCDVKAPSPHFLSFSPAAGEATPRAVQASWTRAAGQVVVQNPNPVSLGRSTAVKLRVTTPPGPAVSRFAVRLTDARGRTAELGEVAVGGLPRSSGVRFAWAQELRLPLTRAKGLDLTRISKVVLVPRSATGSVVLLDAWGWAAGVNTTPAISLPRLDVGGVRVLEGGPGTRTVTVPITVTGTSTVRGPQAVRVLMLDPRTFSLTSTLVTLRPGQRSIAVPLRVVGNDLDDEDETLVAVVVQAVSGLTAGDYVNGAVIVDDDPTPTITLTSPTATAVEGGSLTWTVTLSKPSNRFIVDYLIPVAPPSGTAEMSSDDVTAAWLEQWLVDDEADLDPPVKLSRLPLFGILEVEPGRTSGSVAVHTVADTRAEGAEQVRLEVLEVPVDQGASALPSGTVLTGTVTDAP